MVDMKGCQRRYKIVEFNYQ